MRTPATSSWKRAFTALTRSRASRYAGTDRARNQTVVAISTGRVQTSTRARPASRTNSATSTPSSVSTLTTAVVRPVCRNDDSASTSVVIRVMIRPASSRS
jgi:hypothetical protein